MESLDLCHWRKILLLDPLMQERNILSSHYTLRLIIDREFIQWYGHTATDRYDRFCCISSFYLNEDNVQNKGALPWNFKSC